MKRSKRRFASKQMQRDATHADRLRYRRGVIRLLAEMARDRRRRRERLFRRPFSSPKRLVLEGAIQPTFEQLERFMRPR